MYQTGTETWFVSVRISQSYFVEIKWISKTEKSRQNLSYFTGKRICRYGFPFGHFMECKWLAFWETTTHVEYFGIAGL